VRLLTRFLAAQAEANKDKIPLEPIYTAHGWAANNQAYVLGRRVIGQPGRVSLNEDSSYLDALLPSGDEQIYREYVCKIRQSSPTAEMAWAAGYAAPLLRFIQVRSLTLSIWGTSGHGKSALQALAVSPWGNPEGLKTTANLSIAGVQALLANRRD